MSRIAVTLIGFACLAAPLAAQVAPDSLARRVDEIFAEWNKPSTPGCAVGVGQGGDVRYARGYGIANLDYDVPITSSTIFDIGSVSKQFTAAAIAKLHLDGKLDLDEEVQTYVQELPRYERPVTVRHLVHHISGVRDVWVLMGLAGLRDENVYTEQDIVDMIARQTKLNFTPGSEYLYSNSGYLLLAVIVHRVTGKTLGEYTAETLFKPLGMHNTFFYEDRKRIIKNRAIGYSPTESGGFRLNHYFNFDMGGDGQLYTTVEDLLKWNQNFSERSVGGPKFVDLMRTRGVLNSGDTLDYAFGLSHGEHRGARTISHGGAWGGFRAYLTLFPEQDFSVALTCNVGSASPGVLAERVADVYLAGLLGSPPAETASPATPAATSPAASPEQSERWVGHYWSDEQSNVTRVLVEEGELVLEAFGGSFKLVPTGQNEFTLIGPPVRLTFEAGEREELDRLHVSIGGGTPTVFERFEPAAPTAAALGAYQGEYYSEELDVMYHLHVAENKLLLSFPTVADEEMVPVFEGVFQARGTMMFKFGDPGDQARGFTLDAGRVKNVRFVRR
jgi:CubicO group peptidase (beta-lactamase class C family)